MEYIREINIIVKVDTNKSTDKEHFDNFFDAAKWLFERLSNEERLKIIKNETEGY